MKGYAMTTKPDTLDEYLKDTIEELRGCGYDDSEIGQMISETVNDVLRGAGISDF